MPEDGIDRALRIFSPKRLKDVTLEKVPLISMVGTDPGFQIRQHTAFISNRLVDRV